MRTRFAPSPTGFLHVGALRTALFAWLVAKKENGTFIVRIEDTDQSREVPGATENIIRTLTLAGIPPDEGVMLDTSGSIVEKGDVGPYHQSKRLPLYGKHIKVLIENGHAYHCFCSAERLEGMRKKQQEKKQAPMYDRTCMDLSPEEVNLRLLRGEKSVIRLKVPHGETVTHVDEIYGNLTFKGHTIDDQVLMKSDGFPTYHLAHVIDDHLMKTDIVIRGEEWLSSLPKHLLLFRAFGWTAPRYAHVPLLLNSDRTKLSKRQNDVAAEHYLQKGYLPEALLNFLALLGWNPGTEQEIFTLQDLVESFSLERVQKSGAVFDLQKLEWIQGQWMRRIPVQDFAHRIRPLVTEAYPAAATDPHFTERAALIQQRILFFSEAPDMMAYLYESPFVAMDVLLNPKQKVTKENLPKALEFLKTHLQAIENSDWSYETIVSVLDSAIAESGFKKGQILWPLRALLTGREYSPGAYEVAALLGKKETLKRLEACPT